LSADGLIMAVVVLFALAAVLAGLWFFTRHIATKVESRIPAIGAFADVPGARLHYVDRGTRTGDRPPIVMLHGLGGQLHHFNYALVEELARDTRVIAVDRPGSGYSRREPGEATTLEQQADVVVALLDALGVGRALLVGHSLGGALSLTVALRHPSRVAGLALLAPLTRAVRNLPPVFRGIAVRSEFARRLIASLFATPMFIVNRERVMPQIFGPEQPPSGYPTRAGGLLTLRPSQYIGASEDLGAIGGSLPVIESRYPELNRDDAPPIHVLYGRGDRVLDCEVHGKGFAQRVPRCHLTVVDGGHMLPLTQPDTSARFIREALERARA
jgi:pimeloyl-ACP methyl ester carboxylesterase